MNVRFPQYLHLPLQILWFEPDDMAVTVVCAFFAMNYGGWFFYIAMFVVPYMYGKVKQRYPRGFFRHCLYFLGLAPMKYYPTFFERRFIP